MSHITLGAKLPGEPSAGNQHARFEVAGIGNQLTARLMRHSQRKRGATDRLSLWSRAPVFDPSAAMLAAVLAGGSPADGSCPAAIVVILGDEKGDQLVGSPGVNVSVGWERIPVGSAKGGKQVDRPQRERTEVAPKLLAHVKRISGGVGSAEQLGSCEGQRRRSRSWAYAAGELPGVGGGWHVDTERAAKARNHSRVAEAMAQRRHRV